jgi:hypothetical protein
MVERDSTGGDSPSVPTIADLLQEYRRLTGASYEAMSEVVNREITTGRLHQLATVPPKSFPRDAGTVQRLADLLQVPVATIVLAFAASLGLPVSQQGSHLSITLPPGTDSLEAKDVEAIRAVVRQLVEARNRAAHAGGSGEAGELVQMATGRGKATSAISRLPDLARPELPDLSRVAARRGESEGRRRRQEQDEDADR